MKSIEVTKQFKRDAKKHFLALVTASWAEVLHCLCHSLNLPDKYRDHQLTGSLSDMRDCHIKPDLVLLYSITDNKLILVRLGSHSELGIG